MHGASIAYLTGPAYVVPTALFFDRFYIALFSAPQQTYCARMRPYTSDYIFYRAFFEYPPKRCTYSADVTGAHVFSCNLAPAPLAERMTGVFYVLQR